MLDRNIVIFINNRQKKKVINYYKNKPRLLLTLVFDNLKITGEIKAMQLNLGKGVDGSLQAVNELNQPAQIEAGSVVVSSSDEAVFTVSKDPGNELNLIIRSVGLGSAILNYSADADLGAGVVSIAGSTALEIIPQAQLPAVGFAPVTFGAPYDLV